MKEVEEVNVLKCLILMMRRVLTKLLRLVGVEDEEEE
jgi:hypothetical protein